MKAVGLSPLAQDSQAVGESHGEPVIGESSSLHVVLVHLVLGCRDVFHVVDGQRGQNQMEVFQVEMFVVVQLVAKYLQNQTKQYDELRW